ncbi:hypothetical protein OG896_31595 [Streptomyces sp. NBC_00669]|uniref:hypothetical protein n=1 Tax=Streptomyces sp. NBC_00669 TaxID=2976011 RepID=UPI002E3602BA|nr:hypothetical protein [Streptomyces sp. NBC_00669]
MPEHHDMHGGFGDFDDVGDFPGPAFGAAGPGRSRERDGDDPLRGLFKAAAASGQARTRSAPPAEVRARGAARRRRRTAMAAAAACVALAGTAAGLVATLPRGGDPVSPSGVTSSRGTPSGDGRSGTATSSASSTAEDPTRSPDPSGLTGTTPPTGVGPPASATSAGGLPTYPRTTEPGTQGPDHQP